jgi:hypothetical protein
MDPNLYRFLTTPPNQQVPTTGVPGPSIVPLSTICRDFHRTPSINPRTGRTIKENGPIYKNLVKECGPPPRSFDIGPIIQYPLVTQPVVPIQYPLITQPVVPTQYPLITTPKMPVPTQYPLITTPKMPVPIQYPLITTPKMPVPIQYPLVTVPKMPVPIQYPLVTVPKMPVPTQYPLNVNGKDARSPIVTTNIGQQIAEINNDINCTIFYQNNEGQYVGVGSITVNPDTPMNRIVQQLRPYEDIYNLREFQYEISPNVSDFDNNFHTGVDPSIIMFSTNQEDIGTIGSYYRSQGHISLKIIINDAMLYITQQNAGVSYCCVVYPNGLVNVFRNTRELSEAFELDPQIYADTLFDPRNIMTLGALGRYLLTTPPDFVYTATHIFVARDPENGKYSWCLLLRLIDNNYVFIGNEIKQFTPVSMMVHFGSPRSNSMTTVPWGRDINHNYYDFLEFKIINNTNGPILEKIFPEFPIYYVSLESSLINFNVFMKYPTHERLPNRGTRLHGQHDEYDVDFTDRYNPYMKYLYIHDYPHIFYEISSQQYKLLQNFDIALKNKELYPSIQIDRQ